MTDKEMAEAYKESKRDKLFNADSTEIKLVYSTYLNSLKEGFLAGLKAGKEEAKSVIQDFKETNHELAELCILRKKRIADLEKENAELKVKETKWHKVSEQIPTEEKEYLLKFYDGTTIILYVGIDGNLEPFILTREGFDFYKDVEKWCEIPKE